MKKISQDKILSYIEEHLDSHPGVDEIAEAFGYSPDHFRHLFRTYYDVSLGEYMRRRRLAGAAEQIRKGMPVARAADLYGFQTPSGFARAFRKEYGISASELKNQDDMFLDQLPDPVYDRDRIRVSRLEVPELKMVGKTLLPKKEYGYDLLEETACWLERETSELETEMGLDHAELKKLNCYPQDVIAMWYHDPDNVEMTYLLGPVVKDFSYVPEGWIAVSIPAGKYAIFETRSDSDRKEMAETVRMLCKYIFWEWVPANSARKDNMGFTFERYRGSKAAVYLPLKQDGPRNRQERF